MKTNIFKRCTSLALALIICISAFAGLGTTAFAATKEDVYIINIPRANDPVQSGWGHPALQFMNGWGASEVNFNTVKAMNAYEGDCCYCIEPGVSLYTGDTLSKKAEDFWDNYPDKYNNTISPDMIKIFIGRIMQYGYTGKTSLNWKTNDKKGADELAHYMATQLLIWETVVGERDEDFNKINAQDYDKDNIKQQIKTNNPLRSEIFAYYNAIETKVKSHTVAPSFTSKSKMKAQTIELEWNGNAYTATLSDANNVLSSYDFSGSGLTFSKNGNELTITAKEAPDNDITVTASKGAKRKGVVTWTDEIIGPQTGQRQDIVTYGEAVNDPVTAFLKVKVSTGNCEILKTSEDGEVEGIKFTLTGNGLTYAGVTDSKGVFLKSNIPAGTYTVTEEAIDKYVPQKSQTVTVRGGETATVNFDNILKKFRVKVVKTDIEKGEAQGDASLAGAKYGLFKGDELIDTYVTDSNASFTTDYYICDTDWTLKELESSEGYLVNSTVYKVGADPKLYTVEFNTTENNVTEEVIKGNIAIIKHTDEGSTQIETPEKGAEFQIYLKSAGSFVNADEDERDTIVCDADGFASSQLLPYGVYTVHQTKGWDGREMIADFDVFINEDGKTYKFLINNSNFESYVKVVKLDAETGKQIPYTGAGFEIYDSEGHRISMQFTYPEVTEIHTFYTNSEGYLITPETLPYGEYTLVEVQAPYGYVLESTPVPFSVTQDNSSTDTGVTVVKVSAKDMPQKGIIEIGKTGEVFASVGMLGGGYVDKDGNEIEIPITYSPIYETLGLPGTVFQIYAAEDIVTGDGTVRAYQGELVDEITTDENGKAVSKELYLGKYTVVEKTASDGFYNANEQHDVELTYAGQNVSITSTELSLYNERQRVTVSLAKELEQDEPFGIGMNDEIKNVQFGIFSDEDITAADGSVIPKDALIAYANCDENGNITFNCDLPIGFKWYVKEIATDEHYIISEEKYAFNTEYQGQEVQTIEITVNDGEPIENELIYGVIKGLKTDRETTNTIAGALFGLFRPNETEFTEENAILIAESDKDGIFTFENVPYGDWIVKELQPSENYLPNDETYTVTASADEQVIKLNVVNDQIPDLKTTATIDGEKEVEVKDEITIEDVVEYKHLVPGKEYTIKGVLMDKATNEPFKVDGKEITSDVTFTPEKPNGEVTGSFTFDASGITEETELVVFETLYLDGVEIAAHADIEDEGQTVTVILPAPPVPQTGDESNLGFWIGLGAIALGGLISVAVIYFKKKKGEDNE